MTYHGLIAQIDEITVKLGKFRQMIWILYRFKINNGLNNAEAENGAKMLKNAEAEVEIERCL